MPRKAADSGASKPKAHRPQRGVYLKPEDVARVEQIRARLPEGTSFDATIRFAIKVCAETAWGVKP